MVCIGLACVFLVAILSGVANVWKGKKRQEISNCTIRAALHDETDKGWVWLRLNRKTFVSRMTIKISYGKKSVYCEYREIDSKFVKLYNCGRTRKIEEEGKFVVISDWYRKALGIEETKETEQPTGPSLNISKPRWALFADIRAGCQHPEPGVRMATQIAIWGTWVGFAGLLPVLLDHDPIKTCLECHNKSVLLVWFLACAILACPFWCLSRGLKKRFR